MQATLDGKIAKEAEIREFEHRVFMRKAGFTEDDDCDHCGPVHYNVDCPLYENCDGWLPGREEMLSGNYVGAVGTMEIVSRISFRGSVEDFWKGQALLVDYVIGD